MRWWNAGLTPGAPVTANDRRRLAMHVNQTYVNGKDHGGPLPQSKRAFARSLPPRLGAVEDHIAGQAQRIDALISRVTALETQVRDQALVTRADTFERMIEFLQISLGYKKRRSPRRSPAVR
jgi:hypothetical protein